MSFQNEKYYSAKCWKVWRFCVTLYANANRDTSI